MHRKGDVVPFESGDDKNIRETVEKTRRMTYNYIAANPKMFPDHHKNTDFSKPYDPETDSGLKPAIRQHQMKLKYKQNPEGTMNMAKAVYEFIHVQKFGGMGRAKLHPEAQKYPEAKKEAAKKQATPAAPDLSKPRGIFGRGADVSGKKTGSWFGDLMRDALEVYRGRGDHAQTQAAAVAPQTSQIQNMVRSTQPEQIQKDVKSLAGGTNWKRQKQRIPRAKTKRFHHDWDRSQYAGAGGSQVMGYATDQNQ